MHPWCECLSRILGAEHRSHGNAACYRLGERRDIRLNAVVLIGKPLACPSHTALDLIRKQQGASRVAEFTGGGEELLRNRMDAALALNRLDADGADVSRELCFADPRRR